MCFYAEDSPDPSEIDRALLDSLELVEAVDGPGLIWDRCSAGGLGDISPEDVSDTPGLTRTSGQLSSKTLLEIKLCNHVKPITNLKKRHKLHLGM